MNDEKVKKAIRLVENGLGSGAADAEVTILGGAVIAAHALADHYAELANQYQRQAEVLKQSAYDLLVTGKISIPEIDPLDNHR